MPEMDTALRRWRGRLVLWVVLPYATLVAFYLVVFCVQIRSINDAVCFFNKRVLNAMMMFLDRRHWYAAVLRHKGRHSGRKHATPVTAELAEDGYVTTLSYRGSRRLAQEYSDPHGQRLRILLLLLLLAWRVLASPRENPRCLPALDGQRGRERSDVLARVLPPALRANRRGVGGEVARGPVGERTPRGRSGTPGRRNRVLHLGADHHPARLCQRGAVHHVLQPARQARGRSSGADLPAWLRQHAHPGREVALRPGHLVPRAPRPRPSAGRHTVGTDPRSARG